MSDMHHFLVIGGDHDASVHRAETALEALQLKLAAIDDSIEFDIEPIIAEDLWEGLTTDFSVTECPSAYAAAFDGRDDVSSSESHWPLSARARAPTQYFRIRHVKGE